jgi:hypothetical protein
MDATVITVYGKQEGIAVGYNPTHRGKPSYCPLFVSEGDVVRIDTRTKEYVGRV